MKNNKKQGTHAQTISTQREKLVPINTGFSPSVYNKIEQYRKSNGLPNPQDVVRIAVALFFKQQE